MIIQTIHEIVNPFDVETPLGYGVAIFMMAGLFTLILNS